MIQFQLCLNLRCTYLCGMKQYSDEQFDDIRPFRDEEMYEVANRLFRHPSIVKLIENFFPGQTSDSLIEQMGQFKTIFDFQNIILRHVVAKILESSSDGFTYTGVENIRKDKASLFISNHRDITLDPSLTTFALANSNFNSPEVAIGDNLIQEPWIRDTLRLTKSFIVKRNLSLRELVKASKQLSQYIHYVLSQRNHSVWIAQREGRAKDGNDVTQQGLISMLALASGDSFNQHFEELNITPIAISYEYDPCDVEKVRSLYGNRFLGGYKKKHKEDEDSMKNGILGYKGRINIHFGQPIIEEIKHLPEDMHKNEKCALIRHLIDDQIIRGYKLWPTNYIAKDLFENNSPDFTKYTKAEQQKFIGIVEDKLAKMDGDQEELRSIFYEIYARPAINAQRYIEEGTLYPEDQKHFENSGN